MEQVVVGVSLGVVVIAVIAALVWSRRAKRSAHEAAAALARLELIRDVEERYRHVLDLESAIRSLADQRHAVHQTLDAEHQQYLQHRSAITADIQRLREELGALTDEQTCAEFGLYTPKYDFADSKQYKDALDRVRAKQKAQVKAGTAAFCNTSWHVEGSAAKGRKMVGEQLKLMLRAFNGECDALIAKVRYDNAVAIGERISSTCEALNKLGKTKQCQISHDYLQAKLEELHLFHEYQEKKETEREEQRRIKEEMREEQRAQEELARALKEAEEDERRSEQALLKARAEVEKATGAKHQKLLEKLQALEARLAEAHANKERAVSRAQMTRSGHVYVISNMGSFGEGVYKIGMTRRLDPMDRVKELGDASVPFAFDVHAMIFTEDAPGLECELHRRFHQRRLNLVNERKEFFFVSLQEIEAAVSQLHGRFELTQLAEAIEYRKSLAMRDEARKAPLPQTRATVPAAALPRLATRPQPETQN